MRRWFHFFLLFFIVWLSPEKGSSQEVSMLHYTVEDGLPSNKVYDVYRDSKGYLWLSTDKGVARYNGSKFETFTTFNGLPDNEIFFAREDYYGRIWFATYNNKLCYYEDGLFHTAVNTPFLKIPFISSYINKFHIERDSSVTMWFLNRYEFINISKDQCRLYAADYKAKVYNFISYIEKLPDNSFNVWFPNETFHVNTKGQIDSSARVTRDIRIVYFLSQNSECFMSDSFICSLNGARICSFRRSEVWGALHQVYIDSQGRYFLTAGGIILNDSIPLLRGNDVSAMTRDNCGNYWFSTLNNGIFTRYSAAQKLYDSVYSGNVTYSCARNGFVFFTANNNLYAFKNGRVTRLFDYEKYTGRKYSAILTPACFIDSSNKYYCFYNREHIIIDDVLAVKKKIRRFETPISIIINDIKNIYVIDSNVYVRNRSYITRIEYLKRSAGAPPVFSFKMDDYGRSNRIYCSAKAPDNAIWYSTINGVYKMVGEHGILQTRFGNMAFKYFIFAGNNLVGYTHDNLLVVCRNYNSKPEVDTIPSRNCIWDQCYPLDKEHVLISTNNNYCLLTLPANGAAKPQINTIENRYIPLRAESICSDTANCYFFKNGAIIPIAINSLLAKPAPPILFFKNLKTGEKQYAITPVMHLRYKEAKNLIVSFSTVFFEGNHVTCQYSFGSEEQEKWNNLAGEEINIANPGYGNRMVKVRARSASGDYSEPIVFHLYISEPFWVTWWFIMLCLGGVSLMVAVAVRMRIHHVVREKEKEHTNEIKFMKAEYKALNALMNPHFIFNTLNNVQGLVNKDDKRGANEYLRIFANLIRQNMQNVSLELIPLQKELDVVTNYLKLEKLRFKDRLDYEIHIDGHIDISELFIPPLLIQPLVENSLKHGILPRKAAGGIIQIDVYEEGRYLVIAVKDNGVGINASQQANAAELHKSYGLDNIRMRMQQLSIIQDKEINLHLREVKDEAGHVQWTIASIHILVA